MTEVDQPTARSRCQAMNADLASISDQAEMDFVESISWVVRHAVTVHSDIVTL